MASSSLPSIGGLAFSSSTMQQGLEEVQLAQIDAHRIEGAVVECAHLDVLDAGARQRVDGALAGAQRALGPDVAVVLVLDLQQIARQLPVFTVDLDAERRERRVRLRDRAAQVAQIFLEAVDRDRDLRPDCGCDSRYRSCAARSHTDRSACRRPAACSPASLRPCRNERHSAGETPNRYDTIQPWRR